jgi:hypothetical protein
MTRIRLLCLAVTMALFSVAVPSGASDAATASGPVKSHLTNWTGYEIRGTNAIFGGVTADLIVPKLTCAAGEYSYSAHWAGLGGLQKNDVLYQTGIDADCINGASYYFAWWEYVPGNDPVTYPTDTYPVNSGDHLVITVSLGQTVTMDIDNYGQSWSAPVWSAITMLQAFAGNAFSGECITERLKPAGAISYLPFANFGKVQWPGTTGGPPSVPLFGCAVSYTGPSSGFVSLAKTGATPPTGSTIYRVRMVNFFLQTMANPSATTADGKFTVVWKRSS